MAHRYAVDRESLHFHTPPGTRVPRLLEAFYDWAEQQTAGAVGYFRLEGDRLDDFWGPDGSRQASSFVGFLRTPDGSRVGYWRPHGEALDRASIVLLGSEGEVRVLAKTTGEFILRFATLRTGVEDLSDDVQPSSLGTLLSAVEGQDIRDPLDDASLLESTRALQAWLSAWSEAPRPATPERSRVAELLGEVLGLPPVDQPWQRRFADLVLTGCQCALFGTFVGQNRLPLPPGFEAAVRAFRERDAGDLPEAGLWFRAALELDACGELTVKRTYLEEPNPAEITLDRDGLIADARKMPRAPYWLPAWLGRRLE